MAKILIAVPGIDREKALQIFEDGELLEKYPCDYNPLTEEMESNGGQEFVVAYQEQVYYFICDWDDNPHELSRSRRLKKGEKQS